MKAFFFTTAALATFAVPSAALALPDPAAGGKVQSSSPAKKGLGVIYTKTWSDYVALVSEVTWYFNWAPVPTSEFHGLGGASGLEFVPTIKCVEEVDADIDKIKKLRPKHVLSFNEPDGDKSTGGCGVSPAEAADIYIHKIMPLRQLGIQVSPPSVTSSDRGVDWLQKFNQACQQIDKLGCQFDFVTAHWYGPSAGIPAYLEKLIALYSKLTQARLSVWFKEVGLAGASEAEDVKFVQEIRVLFDNHPNVDRYALFGAFRTSNANGYTGSGSSFFKDDGSLTSVGREYIS